MTLAELREMAKNEFGIERVYESLDAGLADGPRTVFVCSPTAMHSISCPHASMDCTRRCTARASLTRVGASAPASAAWAAR